jgi:hypothetical protein
VTLPIHAPAFYNEIEPYLCAWLNNQIAAGLVPPGRIDGRDIREPDPNDLAGYRQVHLFADVGGWAYAARIAGWPDDAGLRTAPVRASRARSRASAAEDRRRRLDLVLWPAELNELHSDCDELAPARASSQDGGSRLNTQGHASLRGLCHQFALQP